MTNFKLVYDRAMGRLRDYRLDDLFSKDEVAFYNYMRGKLYESIDSFDGCLSDLSYHSETVGLDTEWYFDKTLESKEISILGYGLTISWMEQNMLDITQMNLHLSSRDFKNFSESQNLKQKSEVLDKMREDMSREITEYQLSKLSSLPFFGGV